MPPEHACIESQIPEDGLSPPSYCSNYLCILADRSLLRLELQDWIFVVLFFENFHDCVNQVHDLLLLSEIDTNSLLLLHPNLLPPPCVDYVYF